VYASRDRFEHEASTSGSFKPMSKACAIAAFGSHARHLGSSRVDGADDGGAEAAGWAGWAAAAVPVEAAGSSTLRRQRLRQAAAPGAAGSSSQRWRCAWSCLFSLPVARALSALGWGQTSLRRESEVPQSGCA
jgi:hypothetical protein